MFWSFLLIQVLTALKLIDIVQDVRSLILQKDNTWPGKVDISFIMSEHISFVN